MTYDTDGLCRDSESHRNAPEYSKHPIDTPTKKSNNSFPLSAWKCSFEPKPKRQGCGHSPGWRLDMKLYFVRSLHAKSSARIDWTSTKGSDGYNMLPGGLDIAMFWRMLRRCAIHCILNEIDSSWHLNQLSTAHKQDNIKRCMGYVRVWDMSSDMHFRWFHLYQLEVMVS